MRGSELIIEIRAERKLTDRKNKEGKQNQRNVGRRGNQSTAASLLGLFQCQLGHTSPPYLNYRW